jgi:hypothetical protein
VLARVQRAIALASNASGGCLLVCCEGCWKRLLIIMSASLASAAVCGLHLLRCTCLFLRLAHVICSYAYVSVLSTTAASLGAVRLNLV